MTIETRQPSGSAPAQRYDVPPPQTGSFALDVVSRFLLFAIHLERRLDPFFRPYFDAVLRDRLSRMTTWLINLRRKDEGLALAEERAQPDEEAHLNSIIETFTAQMRGLWKPGHFERGGNTKTHGVVRGEFVVRDDLPEKMRRGRLRGAENVPGLGAFLGTGAVHHAGHRRRRLHEHEHQADGRPGAEAARRRAAHAGPARRLDADLRHARHARERPASALEPSERAGLLLPRPARLARPRLDHAAALDEDADAVRSRTSTSAACRTCSAKGRRCSTRSARAPAEAEPRAAPAAAPARQLPARGDGQDARRGGRRVRHPAPAPDRPAPDADREQRGALADEALAASAGGGAADSEADVRLPGAARLCAGPARSTRGTASPSTGRSGTKAARASGCTASSPGSGRR